MAHYSSSKEHVVNRKSAPTLQSGPRLQRRGWHALSSSGTKTMSVRRIMSALAVVAVFLFSSQFVGPLAVRADLDPSLTYLQAHASNPWVTMALVVAGQSPDTEYIKTFSRTSPTDYETSILALTAAGKNPRTYASEDLVAALESFEQQNQLGDPSLLNDDIFGILALVSAGIPAPDAHVTNLASFIESHQNSDGGWGYTTTGGSDTNSTSAAIMALMASGKSSSDATVTKAIVYLKNTQNDDGGFPYDPSQSYSSSSDSSSDAWVISAIYRIGQDPSSWLKNSKTPLDHLRSLIDPTGFAHYQTPSDAATSFTPVSTAYAVIALSGKYFPVGTMASAVAQQPAGVLTHYLIQGNAGTICIGKISATTALDVVKNASIMCGFTYSVVDSSYGAYLKQIGNDAASGSSGWLYAVNGKEPSIGAGDYQLMENDQVIWFFGAFDASVPSMPATIGVDLSTTIISGSVITPSLADSVGFEVDVSKLAFGSLKPGSVGTAQFTAHNMGTQPIKILGSVTGDGIFRNYLELSNAPWRQFSLVLASDQRNVVRTILPIPAGYISTGTKTGTLTFWATLAN